MNSIKLYLLKVLPFLFILACNPLEDKMNAETKRSFYYNFLKTQETILTKRNSSVLKISEINGTADTTEFKNINWNKELDLFYELDIFKPINKGAYRESIVTADSTITSKYVKISTSKCSIDSLSIKKTNTGELLAVKAYGSKSNFFFKVVSAYNLSFNTPSEQLKSYGLNANKTFIWGKSDSYSIYFSIK